jgi:hypothetical protein
VAYISTEGHNNLVIAEYSDSTNQVESEGAGLFTYYQILYLFLGSPVSLHTVQAVGCGHQRMQTSSEECFLRIWNRHINKHSAHKHSSLRSRATPI